MIFRRCFSTLKKEIELPSSAEVAVVGGGVIGTSIAYHLTRLGVKDVLLLEKTRLTQGCTWHAAGLLGQLRSSYNLTKMLQFSVELYDELEKVTGQSCEWKQVGSLRLASSKDRWLEIKKQYSMAKAFGLVEMFLVSPQEAYKLCPILNIEGLEGAAWIPSDGHVEPSSLTNALAKGATLGGAKILQGVAVTGVEISNRRVKYLITNKGRIEVGKVVNAAGLWAKHLGDIMGTRVPTIAVEHQYAITEKLEGLPPNLPSLRDPDYRLYYKPEVDGLAIGGWEDGTIPREVPWNFGPELYEGNYDRFESLAQAAAMRTPIIGKSGIKKLINGPIPVSADGEPIMGRAPELDNVFVSSGFTAGIGQGGGAGRLMAEWIVHGRPSMDLWPLDIRRFGDVHNSLSFLRSRTVEAYGSYYSVHYPGKESHTARPARTSPIHQILLDEGAIMGNKFGWERPNWFSTDKKITEEIYSFDRPNWFEAVRKEHLAVREKVAIIDQSSFAKLEVSGPRAKESIHKLIVNELSGNGSLVYTQMCNEDGGIEADVTVAQLSDDRFYVITGSGFGTRDFEWIRQHIQKDSNGQLSGVSLHEVTNSFSVLNLTGPKSRDVLLVAGVEEDISNKGFPFMTWKTIHIGHAPVRALRVTYTGELGWELHIPTEYTTTVYQHLVKAGQTFGITNAGYRAIDSLRIEKGFRVWGSDINPETNPYEAGLGFCVKLNKKGGFIGQEALKKIKTQGVKRKLATFIIQDKDLGRPGEGLYLTGKEALLYDNKVIGGTTSGGYAYSLGHSIVFCYIPTALADDKTNLNKFTLQAYGRDLPIQRTHPVNLPLYDPQRVKCTC